MKKLFIIFTFLCLSLPVYASYIDDYTPLAPGAPMCNPKIQSPPRIYDVSEQQAYHKKLKKDFYKKYPDRQIAPNGWETTAPEGAYYKEVVVPYYEWLKTHPYKLEPSNK